VRDAACIVQLSSVTKQFDQSVAVDAIDLAIAEGEFLALLGPSGCGKTTTLRMIAGFERPTYGDISVGGKRVNDLPPYKRAVNTVFQSYALFPHLSVLDNVAFGLRQRGIGRKQRRTAAAEALKMVHLEGRAHARPAELSGGQQQRVALARALVLEPQVLLLDEPLSALDQKLRRETQVELKRLQEELKLTFVFVTHDQQEAMAMADRIAVMKNGRIEQIGSASDLYDAPATPFVAEFIGTLNRIDGVYLDGAVIVAPHGSIPVGRSLVDVLDGASVAVGFRPESVRLADGPTAMPGVIVTVMVLGDAVQLVVQLRSGEEVLARQSRDGRPLTAFPQAGETVGLTVDPGAGMVVAAHVSGSAAPAPVMVMASSANGEH
jgi:ABC-type Fe3+/spermidine/putrescine transport system ATPase subunit